MADPYLKGLREGKYTTEELDDKARRILRTIFRTSMRPEPNYGRFVCPEHYQAARDIAAAGVVLLKNEDNVLPLDVPQGGKILLVGENAVKKMVVGGGSSNLKTSYEINPLEGVHTTVSIPVRTLLTTVHQRHLLLLQLRRQRMRTM